MERIYTFEENRCRCKSCGREWSVTQGDGIDFMDWYPKTKECPACHSKMVETLGYHSYVGDRFGHYIREMSLEDSNRAVKQAEQDLENLKTSENNSRKILWIGIGVFIFAVFGIPNLLSLMLG